MSTSASTTADKAPGKLAAKLAKASPPVRLVLEIGSGLIVIAALSGVGFGINSALERALNDPLRLLNPQLVTRREAPDFELTDQEGRTHRLSELRGHPVVLNFWSIECPPCIREMPALERLARTGRQTGDFTVLTVAVEESFDEVQRAFPRGTELTVLFDPERRVVQESYGTEMYPETFVVDSDGMLRLRFDGVRDWSGETFVELLERY